eukprot:s359_g8.t1
MLLSEEEPLPPFSLVHFVSFSLPRSRLQEAATSFASAGWDEFGWVAGLLEDSPPGERFPPDGHRLTEPMMYRYLQYALLAGLFSHGLAMLKRRARQESVAKEKSDQLKISKLAGAGWFGSPGWMTDFSKEGTAAPSLAPNFFDEFSEGESTYDEAFFHRSPDYNQVGYDEDIPQQAVDAKIFAETPSAGSKEAWQTYWPGSAKVQTNRIGPKPTWYASNDGYDEPYLVARSNSDGTEGSGFKAARWFDSSVLKYNGMGQPQLPAKGTGARLQEADAMNNPWVQRAVNTSLLCKEGSDTEWYMEGWTEVDGDGKEGNRANSLRKAAPGGSDTEGWTEVDGDGKEGNRDEKEGNRANSLRKASPGGSDTEGWTEVDGDGKEGSRANSLREALPGGSDTEGRTEVDGDGKEGNRANSLRKVSPGAIRKGGRRWTEMGRKKAVQIACGKLRREGAIRRGGRRKDTEWWMEMGRKEAVQIACGKLRREEANGVVHGNGNEGNRANSLRKASAGGSATEWWTEMGRKETVQIACGKLRREEAIRRGGRRWEGRIACGKASAGGSATEWWTEMGRKETVQIACGKLRREEAIRSGGRRWERRKPCK